MLVRTLSPGLNRASRLGFWLYILTAVTTTPAALAQDCLDTPVSTQEWGWVGLAVNPEFVGDWRMNVSAQSSTLTRVHVKVQLAQKPDHSWGAQVLLAYPANPSVGLPYTFQKFQLQYRTASGPQTAVLDWTRGCAITGHSLFPGQEFAASVDLPDSIGLTNLESPSLMIWGSEN